jgi:hypothetical protein
MRETAAEYRALAAARHEDARRCADGFERLVYILQAIEYEDRARDIETEGDASLQDFSR